MNVSPKNAAQQTAAVSSQSGAAKSGAVDASAAPTFDSWENDPGAKLVKIDPAKDYVTVTLDGPNDLKARENLYGGSMSAADRQRWDAAIVAANGGKWHMKLKGWLAAIGFKQHIKMPLPPNAQLDGGVLQGVILNKALGAKGTAIPNVAGGAGGGDASGRIQRWEVYVAGPNDKDPGTQYYLAPGPQPNTYAVMSAEQAKKLYPSMEQRLNVFGGA